MKRHLLLAAMLLALGPLAYAGTAVGTTLDATILVPAPPAGADLRAICGDLTATPGDDTAAGMVPEGGAPSSDTLSGLPRSPAVSGKQQCPDTNACTCGLPTFDPFDSACVPGVDLGFQKCGSLHCPDGQTVHVRDCPCDGCGARWSDLFCAD